MIRQHEITTLRGLYMRRRKINLSPPYQRAGEVWNSAKKQSLWHSFFMGYDVPKLYFHAVGDTWDCVDGKQRLTTIFDGFEGDVKIPTTNGLVAYSAMEEETREKLNSFNLDLIVMTETTDTQIREMFLLHQNGSPLNTAEKRNAIGGAYHAAVVSLAAHHFFKLIPVANSRLQHHSIAAQMLLLSLRGVPTAIGSVPLRREYLDCYISTPALVAASKATTAVLTRLVDEFAGDKIEVGPSACVSLFYLALKSGIGGMRFWWPDFESRRRDALMRRGPDDVGMMVFTERLTRHTESAEAVDLRNNFLRRDFLTSNKVLEAVK